jgi:hypothetical protein
MCRLGCGVPFGATIYEWLSPAVSYPVPGSMILAFMYCGAQLSNTMDGGCPYMSLLSTRSFFVFLIQALTRPYSPGCMLLSDGVPPPVLYVVSSVLNVLSSCEFLNWSFLLQVIICVQGLCWGP